MGPRSFDVDVESGRITTEALRADTKLVDLRKHVEFKRRYLRVGVPHADRPRGRFFCQRDALVGSAA